MAFVITWISMRREQQLRHNTVDKFVPALNGSTQNSRVVVLVPLSWVSLIHDAFGRSSGAREMLLRGTHLTLSKIIQTQPGWEEAAT